MDSDVSQYGGIDRDDSQRRNNLDQPLPNPFTEPQGDSAQDFATIEENNFPKNKKTYGEMNLREKVKYVASNITVEPLVICYMVPNILSTITTLNLNLEKACRVSLGYNDTVCTAIANREADLYENETQAASTVVADLNTWTSALQSAGPAILVLFVGSWSDRRHRRKPLALSPIIGELCSTVGLFLCAIFLTQWPLEVAGLIEAGFPAISGGSSFMIIACYSYIGEVTSEEDRTFRIGMFGLFVTLAAPVATSVSGYAHESLSYLGVYSLVSVLYVLAVWYTVRMFKEPKPPVPRPQGVSFLADFFDWHHVKNTISVALKSGSEHRRFRIILVVVLYITIEGPQYGESGNLFLFTLNKYHWSSNEFAFYSTYDILVGLIGNAFVTLILIRIVKIRDCYIGVIGLVGRIIALPIFAFGNATWHMYAARAISTLFTASVISMRSLATKMVAQDELGQLLGFLAIVEAIIPVAFSPLYSAVFAATLATFPGAYFLLTAGVSAIAIPAFLIIEKLQRSGSVKDERENSTEDVISTGATNLAFNGRTEKNQNTYL